MDNATTIGLGSLAASILGILFFVVKYFVKALNKKDEDIKELTEKLIKISEENIISHNQLAQSIDASTTSNKEVAKATKDSSDKLTALMLRVIKSNGKTK